MASTCVFMLSFLMMAVLVPAISATEFIVGDDKGWTLGFDYQAWAEGKQFYVGDKLVFRYLEGAHNVVRVNGTGFQECTTPASTEALTTGNDVITLASPGRKWYICSKDKHCENGNMKLVITVQSQIGSPAPSPSPSSPIPVSTATGITPIYSAWMLAVFVVLTVILI